MREGKGVDQLSMISVRGGDADVGCLRKFVWGMIFVPERRDVQGGCKY